MHKFLETVKEADRYGDIAPFVYSLYAEASEVLGEGYPVVELGMREGGSTAIFLIANEEATLHKRKHGMIFSIDHDRKALPLTENYHREIGLPDRLHVNWVSLWGNSLEIATGWNTEIGLLFIDSDHRYQYTLEELQAWAPKVHSTILLHDTETLGPAQNWGVKRAVEEYVTTNPGYWQVEYLTEGCGMAVMRRKLLEI